MMPPLETQRERERVEDSAYKLTSCLQHRPREERRPGLGTVAVCANPWCRTTLEAPQGPRNTSEGIQQLLTSLDASQRALQQRQAMAQRLIEDARHQRTITAARLRDVLGYGVVAQEAVERIAAHEAGPATSQLLLRQAVQLLAPTKGVRGYTYDADQGRLVADLGINRVVVAGRLISGKRGWNIATVPAAITSMGLDNNVNNPADTTRQLDTTAANRSIKAYDATFPSIVPADGSVASAVKVTVQSTWTQADNPGPKTFVVKRIGQLNATDNSLDSLYSLLGGTTPTSILNADYTGLTTFTLKPQIETTLSNQSAQ